MENEDASHKYAPLFDVYHHLLIVPRIFDCFNQRFLNHLNLPLTLLPDDVISQRIGQLHSLAVAK
jgi:hypothetical protein